MNWIWSRDQPTTNEICECCNYLRLVERLCRRRDDDDQVDDDDGQHDQEEGQGKVELDVAEGEHDVIVEAVEHR